MSKKVTIIGCGALGSSIRQLLEASQPAINKEIVITSWDKFHPHLDSEAKQLELQGALLSTDYVFFCIGSAQLKNALADVLPQCDKGVTAVLFSKGLDAETGFNVSDLISNIYPEIAYALVSGPMLASELKQGMGGAANIISQSSQVNEDLATVFKASGIISETVIGSPSPYAYLGVLKNIYATFLGAVSAIDGYEGKNLRGYLFTKIVKEMQVIVQDLGFDPGIVISQAGLADLIATGSSTSSMNYSSGRAMVQDGTIEKKGEGLLSFENMFKKLHSSREELPIIYLLNDCILSPAQSRQLISDYLQNR